MRALYTLAMYLLTPLIFYRLLARGLRMPGYYARWRERFGYFRQPDFKESLWIHAVSVGEVNAAAPLIEALRKRYTDIAFVVTTVTPTGSDRVRQLWDDKVFHVYLPYDLPAAVKRFLQRTRPRLAVVMETEIWPNLFLSCEAAGIPVVVANARLSDKSLRGYGPVRPIIRAAIRSARFVAAQSQQDADRLLTLGARPERLRVVGNLKFDLQVPPSLFEDAAGARVRWGSARPVWIAASTHEGEELAVIEAHSRLLNRFPDALLLVAPRHPERFKPMVQLCRSYGFATRTRSEDDDPDGHCQCFVIDTLGELVNFIACADVAFVAGSLEAIGGHNVLEPAALGVPVLVGPHTFNFEEVTDLLLEQGAALRVADSEELSKVLQVLLSDPAQRQRMGEAAQRTVGTERGAVDRTLEVIGRLLRGEIEPGADASDSRPSMRGR
ncbi:lipid IV(A) 3-deoxy-D-manno-octulosonic acid transferase [Aquimonas sp.]|uniref:lipid IV(A) 3-deoxy-D-manno-octulosonic acid transferase n=1 Tax=Aquimonas sp. TaxID=1872588 RepID=UPI0037BF38D0